VLKSEFIFAIGDVAFSQCHASTIAESKGRLIAAWFGGSGKVTAMSVFGFREL